MMPKTPFDSNHPLSDRYKSSRMHRGKSDQSDAATCQMAVELHRLRHVLGDDWLEILSLD